MGEMHGQRSQIRAQGLAQQGQGRGRIALDKERRAIADRIIDNSGSLKDLEQQVDEVWQWAQQLPAAEPDAGSIQ